jgi:hypothetical protein
MFRGSVLGDQSNYRTQQLDTPEERCKWSAVIAIMAVHPCHYLCDSHEIRNIKDFAEWGGIHSHEIGSLMVCGVISSGMGGDLNAVKRAMWLRGWPAAHMSLRDPATIDANVLSSARVVDGTKRELISQQWLDGLQGETWRD